jgi:hypothetical protein
MLKSGKSLKQLVKNTMEKMRDENTYLCKWCSHLFFIIFIY